MAFNAWRPKLPLWFCLTWGRLLVVLCQECDLPVEMDPGNWNLHHIAKRKWKKKGKKKKKKLVVLLQVNLMRVFLSVPPPKSQRFSHKQQYNCAMHKSAETRKRSSLRLLHLLSRIQHEAWHQEKPYTTFIHGVFDS